VVLLMLGAAREQGRREGGDSDSGSGFVMGVFGWSVMLALRPGKVRELVIS
jgi:hypothetical protein